MVRFNRNIFFRISTGVIKLKRPHIFYPRLSRILLTVALYTITSYMSLERSSWAGDHSCATGKGRWEKSYSGEPLWSEKMNSSPSQVM